MPFEKIMERSGGQKEATDVWVIRYRNFKTIYYTQLESPAIFLFLFFCYDIHSKFKIIVNIMSVLCTMLLQATIIRNYFVKTQTSVASFSPPDLSIIFSNGMYLKVSPSNPSQIWKMVRWLAFKFLSKFHHILTLGICVLQSQ